jgi:hypothetical protein
MAEGEALAVRVLQVAAVPLQSLLRRHFLAEPVHRLHQFLGFDAGGGQGHQQGDQQRENRVSHGVISKGNGWGIPRTHWEGRGRLRAFLQTDRREATHNASRGVRAFRGRHFFAIARERPEEVAARDFKPAASSFQTESRTVGGSSRE